MKSRILIALSVLLLSIGAIAQQPMNVVSISGTAPSTAGKFDVKAADGDAFVRCNAASTCPVNANESGTWSVRIQDGSGNGITSNSTTYTAKFGLDANILGTLGTAFSTAGKVDVKGADGDVFVRQTTGTNLHAVLDTTSTTAVTQGTAANLNATVVQATGTNLHVVCDSGCGASSTISLIPATSGGLTLSHLLAAATNNATALKASAGQLYGASVYNNAGYPVYLKFYNKASSPAPASDTIVYEVPVQAGTEREVHTEEGLAFATGIAYALVKGISDTDNTSVAANDATVDLIYK